jgi:hypothetical protein
MNIGGCGQHPCATAGCQPLSLDPQLLEEREFWRQKYTLLKAQSEADLASLKDSIYKQCTDLMEEEFRSKELKFQEQIDHKNSSLAAMAKRVAQLEARQV